MTEHTQRSRVLMIVLISGIALVVIVALIAVFTRGGPVQYAADTPEGVVQRYSQAVVEGDYDAAESYLTPELVENCRRPQNDLADVRVTLLNTLERDTTATVEVGIAASYGGGLFGSSTYEYEASFSLRMVDGDWLIEGTPWELAVCEEGVYG
jgi:hypothetical protein